MDYGLQQKAALLADRQEWEALKELAKSVLLESPDAILAKYYLALGLLQTDQTEEAERIVDAQLQLVPFSPEFLLLKGKLYFARSDLGQTRQIAHSILRQDDKDLEAYLLLARVEIRAMRFDKAREAIQCARAIDPGSEGVAEVTTLFQTITGEAQDKSRADQILRSNPTSPSGLIHKITVLTEHGKPAQAYQLALRSLRLHPDHRELKRAAQDAKLANLAWYRLGEKTREAILSLRVSPRFALMGILFLSGLFFVAAERLGQAPVYRRIFFALTYISVPVLLYHFRRPFGLVRLYMGEQTRHILLPEQKPYGLVAMVLLCMSLLSTLFFVVYPGTTMLIYVAIFTAFATIPVFELSDESTYHTSTRGLMVTYGLFALLGLWAVWTHQLQWLLLSVILMCSAYTVRCIVLAYQVAKTKLSDSGK